MNVERPLERNPWLTAVFAVNRSRCRLFGLSGMSVLVFVINVIDQCRDLALIWEKGMRDENNWKLEVENLLAY